MVPSQINEHLESQSLSIELTVKISFPNSKSRDILRGVLRSNNFEVVFVLLACSTRTAFQPSRAWPNKYDAPISERVT